MNKETAKYLVLGAGITAIILIKWYNMKVDAMEASYNGQLALLQDAALNNTPEKPKNDEFLSVGDECELMKQFKLSVNYLSGASFLDELPVYSAEDKDLILPLLKNTTHFIDENGALRKSFLYDVNITIANMLGADDFPLRLFKYEYTGGVLNKGDKGAAISNLQELLNLIYYKNEPFPVNGTYDKDTYNIVVKTFKGTTALIDSGAGTLAKEFVSNFSDLIQNITYQYVDNAEIGNN